MADEVDDEVKDAIADVKKALEELVSQYSNEATVSDIIHVLPHDDICEHVTDGRECWCNPRTEEKDGGFLVVHNAAYDEEEDQYAHLSSTISFH